MRAKSLHLLVGSIVIAVVLGYLGTPIWAQETPTETPVVNPTNTPVQPTNTPVSVVTPKETPAETPTSVPTNTPKPVPTESSVETPTAVPTAVPTNTQVPPTNTPVPTETQVETPTVKPETPTAVPTNTPVPLQTTLQVLNAQGMVGGEITVGINIENAVDVDAFGFDIVPSADVLNFVRVEKANTLTKDFFSVIAQEVGGTINIRLSAVGGPSIINGNGLLLNLVYGIKQTDAKEVSLSIQNLVDDLAKAKIVAGVITIQGETPTSVPTPTTGETPTNTPVPATPTTGETPTNTPVPATPTTGETPTNTPVPATPTQGETPTNTPVPATPTQGETATQTPVPVTEVPTAVATATLAPTATFTPTSSPTALILNPALGVVAVDELGGTYPRGAAVHNFDIGISDKNGNLQIPQLYDGLPDPSALGPYLIVNFLSGGEGIPVPIAKDMEFSGETLAEKDGGNGSEGAYFLIGGTIGSFSPVSGRLGANGGTARGGIDYNKDGKYDINFGFFKSDIIPVKYDTPKGGNGVGKYNMLLADLEPAGNGGFYVLDKLGNIMAEGTANAALETKVPVTANAEAVSIKIFHDSKIDVSNSQYAPAGTLVGKGAYVLDSLGKISLVGDAPAIDAGRVSMLTSSSEESYVAMDYMPNAEGTDFIGLAVLRSDGHIFFAPFTTTAVTPAIEAHVERLLPIKSDNETGIPNQLARCMSLEVRDGTNYAMDENGNNVLLTGRKVGFWIFDGFGGSYVGGDSTRYAPAYGNGDRVINGLPVVGFPVTAPYFGVDVLKDAELSWPVKR